MRVAIDAHCIGENLTGNETYTINLVKNLVSLYPEEEWQIYVSNEGGSQLEHIKQKNVVLKKLKSKKAFERYVFEIPKLLRDDPPDVLHTQYNGPVSSICPIVLTVHDISYERYPQYFPFMEQVRLKTLVPYFIKRSAAIITVSEFSKNEIITKYKVGSEKVAAIHCGIDNEYFNSRAEDSDRSALEGLHIDQPYLLYVGALQPRKNVEGMLKAAVPLVKKYPKLKIVIAGPKKYKGSEIQDMIAQSDDLKGAVKFTGFVDQQTLRALYRSCLTFVYVPFYEGFGLPVIEAMACGAPVITSNVSSLPEVAGSAAMLVNPRDLGEIREAMDRLISSQTLREDLRKKGLERSKDFNWGKAARETYEIYKKVAVSR